MFNSPDEGVPLGHLRKILPGCQWVAKVPNGVQTLPKILIACYVTDVTDSDERYRRQTDRRQTDGRTMTYSEREREFTFGNKTTGKRCFVNHAVNENFVKLQAATNNAP